MPNATKVEKVKELTNRLTSAEAALVSDYRGLSVKDATELRRSLQEADATFSVVKNTLTKLAAQEAGFEGLADLVDGPTAITFVAGDAIMAAKRLAEAARRLPSLELKGAVLDGRVLTAEEARSLHTVEAREVSVAKVAGMLQAPLARMVFLLRAPLQRIAYAMAERGRQAEGSMQS